MMCDAEGGSSALPFPRRAYRRGARYVSRDSRAILLALFTCIYSAMSISFRTLSADECQTLLAAHHVGRLAYAYKQRVDIEPLHYVADGEWLYLRTASGSKVSMLEHQPWVALEVDEVHGLFDWQSVVVHGSVQVLDPHDGVDAEARWQHAVDTFRRIVPQAFADGDPTPQRDVMLRVHMSHVEGRSASATGS
jgi:uncharacterized protein